MLGALASPIILNGLMKSPVQHITRATLTHIPARLAVEKATKPLVEGMSLLLGEANKTRGGRFSPGNFLLHHVTQCPQKREWQSPLARVVVQAS